MKTHKHKLAGTVSWKPDQARLTVQTKDGLVSRDLPGVTLEAAQKMAYLHNCGLLINGKFHLPPAPRE